MCYHVSMEERLSAAALKLGLIEPTQDNEKRFVPEGQISGFDFPWVPIVVDENSDQLDLGKWWLQQPWDESFNSKFTSLNTTIENASSPNSNATRYKDNRCLIVVAGFYEWKWLDGKGKNKEKHFIYHPEGLMRMAGIYSEWHDSELGEDIKTVSILTRPANSFMAEIHNTKKRMPIILKKSAADNWLRKELNMEDFGDEMNDYFEALELKSDITEAPLQKSLF